MQNSGILREYLLGAPKQLNINTFKLLQASEACKLPNFVYLPPCMRIRKKKYKRKEKKREGKNSGVASKNFL